MKNSKSETWKDYFNLKGVKPGRLFVYGYGTLDFASDALPLELCQRLYEKKYPLWN